MKMWDPVIDLFEKRLAGWKMNYLSRGRRLTLIKIMLTNLLIYYLSVLTVPVNIAKKLENIQCRFLWEDEEGTTRYHLVK